MTKKVLFITSPESETRGQKEVCLPTMEVTFRPREIELYSTLGNWVFVFCFWWHRILGRPPVLVSRIETDDRDVFILDPPAAWILRDGALIIPNCQWSKVDRFFAAPATSVTDSVQE